VIVVLRDQLLAVPARARSMRRRMSLEASYQAPVRARVRALGGTVRHVLRTFDAFTADLDATGRARLAADPSVAGVVPNTLVSLPSRGVPGLSGRPSRGPEDERLGGGVRERWWTAAVPVGSEQAAARA
jgi:hypothetical protein